MNGEMAWEESISKRQARTAGAGDARPRTARCRAPPVRRGDGWAGPPATDGERGGEDDIGGGDG